MSAVGRQEGEKQKGPSHNDLTLQARQVSTDGGIEPAWAHSGRELFYRSEGSLMAVDVVTTPTFTPGQPQALFSVAEYLIASTRSAYDMTADDQRFVMIRDEEALVEETS